MSGFKTLWGLFNQDAQQKPLALPAPNELEGFYRGDLALAFANAVHGYKCRTQSFRLPDADEHSEVWQQACLMQDNTGWMVLEITRAPLLDNPDVMVSGHKIVKEHISFFDAVCFLTKFEISRISMLASATGKSKEDLELEHFQAFAEREGIVFDIEGKPHPTVHGEVQTKGKFTDEALARARAVQMPDHKVQKRPLASLVPLYIQGDKEAFASLIGNMKQRNIIAETMECLTKIITLYELIVKNPPVLKAKNDITQITADDLNYPLSYPFTHGDKLASKSRAVELMEILKDGSYIGSRRDTNINTRIQSHLSQARHTAHRLPTELADIMKRNIASFELAGEALKAKAQFQRLRKKYDKESAGSMQSLEDHVYHIETMGQKFDIPDEEIQAIKAYISDGKKVKVPQHLHQQISDMLSILSEYEMATQRLEKRVQTQALISNKP
jgi:predicted FMN-binding regulatory protein PaiB